MSYKKGALKKGALHWVDGKPSKEEDIYLPHSCDEWVIGGEKEARDLIDDLMSIIKTL